MHLCEAQGGPGYMGEERENNHHKITLESTRKVIHSLWTCIRTQMGKGDSEKRW